MPRLPILLLAALVASGAAAQTADLPRPFSLLRARAGGGDRPAWLAAIPGRSAVTVDVPDCPQTCEVTVRRPGESEAAVPLDRVASTGGSVTLFVPEGPLTVTVRDGRTGERLAEPLLPSNTL